MQITKSDYIKNLSERLKMWVLTSSQIQKETNTDKKKNRKPTDNRRHTEQPQTHESHNSLYAKRRQNGSKRDTDSLREMRALVKECKHIYIYSASYILQNTAKRRREPKKMIQRVGRRMEIKDINPHIKTLGKRHQIINFQGLRCGMDTTTNVSDPNAIWLTRHLITRRKRLVMDQRQDNERMWADYFLHRTPSTGKDGTQTISIATVATAIQITGMELEVRKDLLTPSIKQEQTQSSNHMK